ncbi:pantetheine-phosphate adenylyltransferase [Tissierella creatinophila]|uniref:Phosphopantetheine adenylyltransferase n=1 Tax=Tissierella creatinophila DSM 6911 TaxID=1123403 RepID=A0A1U7M326_TISCR|nr:pantetheine-phosphate adenylyltransferase [Tissierella creatinophila]OLS01723.1 phosphopantetheine adenylyltransferase [Tissierella creatinophila DSM 6911]
MKVIYPGSFDPVTYGHLDIIERCSKKFDYVIIAVLNNVSKKEFFTIDERIKLLEETTKEFRNVEIDSFSGLLADYAKEKKCSTMIRGLRAVSDYEYEMQMALVNKKLDPDIETLFMVSRSEYVYLSSSIVKEIALNGGSIDCFVPKIIEKSLKNKIRGGL